MIFKYFLKQSSLNTKQARWMEFLCEFDFMIKHVRGKEYKVVDALSRKFHVACISVCKTNLREKILDALASDKFYLEVKREF